MTVTTTLEGLQAVVDFFGDRLSVDESKPGEPESPGGLTIVGVTVVDASVERDMGRHERWQSYLAMWMCNLAGGDEEAVETALAAYKDDVWDAFLAVRKTNGHPLNSSRLNDTLASLPDYQRLRSGETRRHPFILSVPLRRPLP